MSFLSPLVLGGLALVALPWLIHRIRRPERETVRFSSLMFVPGARREVIERRRLQHILLMLVRMAALALLALAFARPFLDAVADAGAAGPEAGDHVLLFDVSASMSDEVRFEAARQAALRTISGLPSGSRVAVIAFARTARVDVPLYSDADPAAGTPDAAREAVRSLAATWEATNYTAALQAAERQLGAASSSDVARVIHLVSDLQAAGLEAEDRGWRLAGSIRLEPVPVLPAGDNASVDEVALRWRDDRTEVGARIRNHTDLSRTVTARLLLEGRPALQETLIIPPGNASQVRFAVNDLDPSAPFSGRVEIDADGLAADNRRFFAWNPDRPRRVAVLAEDWPAARLLHAAVPDDDRLPWRLHNISRADIATSALAGSDVIILPHTDGLTADDLERLRGRLADGAGLWILPTPNAVSEPLEAFLAPDLRFVGKARPDARGGEFARITWVDLAHPVFHPFRAPVYNDFSSLRFWNHHRLDVTSPGVAVLARFDPEVGNASAGDPAIVELRRGAGRIIVWSAGIDPPWSSLSRDPRFVALVHESLRHLAGKAPTVPPLHVGDPVTAPVQVLDVPGPWLLDFATGPALTRAAVGTGEGRPLDRPGLYTWRSESRPGFARTDAVNLDPRESDPRPLDPTELQLRLAGAEPVLPAENALPEHVGEGGARRIEYGRVILLLVLCFLACEAVLARHYTTHPKVA